VKLKLFPLVVVIALLVLPAAAPAASTKQLKRQVVTLKAQVKRLKAANATLTAANTKLTTDLGTRTGERDAARSQLGTAQPAADRVPGLEADNARLVAEKQGVVARRAVRGGPAAVGLGRPARPACAGGHRVAQRAAAREVLVVGEQPVVLVRPAPLGRRCRTTASRVARLGGSRRA
jgi:hypothetical protein